MSKIVRTLVFGAGLLAAVAVGPGCTKSSKVSEEQAKQHVEFLAKAVQEDVEEVRKGLPEGAKHLEDLYKSDTKPADDLKAVRNALERARSKVQDLRVAKSTFFALATTDGTVLRNDQEQDRMAGKNFFTAFPELKQATQGKYVETRGSMPEASGVRGPDGEWVAAQPIIVDGATKGLYVTGWSWSAYAYRLENALRSELHSKTAANDKMPLAYVYVLVDKNVYGAPVSPQVNAKAIADRDPFAHMQSGLYATQLEITDRDFGLAVKTLPVLGKNVAVAVLRSET